MREEAPQTLQCVTQRSDRNHPVADPIFWLGLSLLLVAVSLTAVLMTALPAMRELARAARSAEKLFDTLSRELPPTLEAIRLTGMEISNLTDGMNEGVQSASRVVGQVDQSLSGMRKQTKRAQTTTRSLLVGFKAAWKTFRRSTPQRRSSDSFVQERPVLEFGEQPYQREFYEDKWEYGYQDSYESLDEEELPGDPSDRSISSPHLDRH